MLAMWGSRNSVDAKHAMNRIGPIIQQHILNSLDIRLWRIGMQITQCLEGPGFRLWAKFVLNPWSHLWRNR